MKTQVFAVDVGYGNTKCAFRIGSDLATMMFLSLAHFVPAKRFRTLANVCCRTARWPQLRSMAQCLKWARVSSDRQLMETPAGPFLKSSASPRTTRRYPMAPSILLV
jgi:hypothetical protein